MTLCDWRVKTGIVSVWVTGKTICDSFITHGPDLSALEIGHYKAPHKFGFPFLSFFPSVIERNIARRNVSGGGVPCDEEMEDVSDDGCGDMGHDGSGLESMRWVTLPTRFTVSCCCSTAADSGVWTGTDGNSPGVDTSSLASTLVVSLSCYRHRTAQI